MDASTGFAGKAFVVRVDEATAHDGDATLVEDLQFLTQRSVRPIVIAPDANSARAIVRAMNRNMDVAVGLSGADAALLPHTPAGIGRVNAPLLRTLMNAGYVPVIEPTAFAVFGSEDPSVVADDVASAIAAACEAARAIFFHRAGGVTDPKTHSMIDELTPAEALALADDERFDPDLRLAMRAAAFGVRGGVPAAQIVDGRVAHASVVELLTAQHLGTQVIGGIVFAA